jgi:hypothetical protein
MVVHATAVMRSKNFTHKIIQMSSSQRSAMLRTGQACIIFLTEGTHRSYGVCVGTEISHPEVGIVIVRNSGIIYVV